MHFTIPLDPSNVGGFRFPGEYVGQYGVYEAVKHLYLQNKDLKGLVKEDTLYANKKFFATDLENAILNVRNDFREKHKLPHDGTIIFVAPGNEVNEAEFCIENCRRGVKEFLLKYSSPTSLSPRAPPLEQYTTVLSLHKGSPAELFVRDFLKTNEWYGRLVIVTNENNEHINAMAASD